MLIDSNELKVELEKLKQHSQQKGIIECSFNMGLESAIEMVRILEIFANNKEEVNENSNRIKVR